jgi:hypothetical protein
LVVVMMFSKEPRLLSSTAHCQLCDARKRAASKPEASPTRLLCVDAVARWATTHQGGVARALFGTLAVGGFATLVAVVVATETLRAGLDTEELEAGADARA